MNRHERNRPLLRHLLLAAFALLLTLEIAAQNNIPCPPEKQDLVPIPEIVTSGGKLTGTIIVSAREVNIPFRQPFTNPPGNPPAVTTTCSPQFVRYLRDGNRPLDVLPPNTFPLPLPGPTLRARVGDLVQITFLNHIDPSDFPYSVDRGEAVPGGGCDEVFGVYPKNTSQPNAQKPFPPVNDIFPNCFHGSSTANIHFHGTHTNPNSTGDNVFVEVRPSLRLNDQPVVTADTVREPFTAFFQQCEQKLRNNPLRLWPKTWNDMPQKWIDDQLKLLHDYDQSPRVAKKLLPIDLAQRARGTWPQYYIGAYPYCFRLPEYRGGTLPPLEATGDTSAHAAHTGGAGEAEIDESQDPRRPVIMGQAPGLHWYHAHKHGSTAINVANGMTGAFVIEGAYDDELDAFYGAGWMRKQPVIVINQLGVSPNLMRAGSGPDKGPDFSVNGRLRPTIQMKAGEVQMWRIVNTSGRAGVFFPGPPAGFNWKQIAQDGVQFADVNYQAALNQPILLASGNRMDLLVQAPLAAPSAPVAFPVQNEVDPQDLSAAALVPLFYVNVTGTVYTPMGFIPKAPAFPPFLSDITDEEVKATRIVTFSSTGPGAGGVHKIDGKQFSGEVGQVVRLNTVEEWKVVNETFGPPISHPFHIHINPFQVVEVFDPNAVVIDPKTNQPVINPDTKKPYPLYVFDKAAVKLPTQQCLLDPLASPKSWKPCGTNPTPTNAIWWDVFPIPSGVKATDANGKPINGKDGKQVQVPGYFKMRSRFVDYSGYYVMHCHILAHEDRGMMSIVEVSPLQSPYSHH